MYGFDKSNENTSLFMDAGINENVELKEVAFEPAKQDGTGEKVLRFYFENDKGQKFSHVEFPIDPTVIKEQARAWGVDPVKLTNERNKDLGSRVMHILSVYLPKEQLEFKADTWEEFCKGVVSILGNTHKGIPIRIKVFYNKKDYLTFPSKTFRPFIQKMSEPNLLRIDPKWERIVPLAPDQDGAAGTGKDLFPNAVPEADNTPFPGDDII
jgi:hypothetical protein